MWEENDLYYIYDNLNNQDEFEKAAQILDRTINCDNIQAMSKDDINNATSRKMKFSILMENVNNSYNYYKNIMSLN